MGLGHKSLPKGHIEDGETIDDCVVVSNLINPILDSNDPISDNYILDVCSKEGGVE